MKAKIKLIKADDPCEIIEVCPLCGAGNRFKWDTKKFGYLAYCHACGAGLLLCDECQHRDEMTNEPCECNDYCDWHSCDGKKHGECYRVKEAKQDA